MSSCIYNIALLLGFTVYLNYRILSKHSVPWMLMMRAIHEGSEIILRAK